MLSVLRRIAFMGIVLFLICNILWNVLATPLAFCIIIYIVLVLATVIYCLVDKSEKMNFIEVIVRQDLRDPLIRNSKRFYQSINQFFSTFLFRKRRRKHRGFKESVKLFFAYLIIGILAFIILCAIIAVWG